MTVQNLPEGWHAFEVKGQFEFTVPGKLRSALKNNRIVLRGYMWTSDYEAETLGPPVPDYGKLEMFFTSTPLPTHWWPTDRKTPAKYAIYSPAPQQGDMT